MRQFCWLCWQFNTENDRTLRSCRVSGNFRIKKRVGKKHLCRSPERVGPMSITSSQSGILSGLHGCQAARKRGRSLPERPNRSQSNSAACADIKHYCILTFHMDCNSAFSTTAAGSLKSLFVLRNNLVLSCYVFSILLQRKKWMNYMFPFGVPVDSRFILKYSPETAKLMLCGDWKNISNLN